ncbi:MAG TPA: hypothetical protein VKD00_03910 [Methyloceanibacter sp.]|nr:hypothetical protein [Methyloceanibacter sp.]
MAQTANTSAQADPLEQACLLVGRFQYHFGRIEQKIDHGVIKLFDLDENAGPIVTGSLDFAKKLNLVRTAASQQAGNAKDRKFGEDTCKRVFGINDVRQLVIHSSFEPTSSGDVQFRRTVAKDGRVRVHDQVWGEKEFNKQYAKINKLADDLGKLVDVIKPAPVQGVITWLSALSEPVPFHRPESPGMRKVYQALFSPIPGSKKSDR